MDSRDTAKYRAAAGTAQGFGQTPQEALSSLMELVPDSEVTPIVILPYNQGDRFFSETQHERLQELKGRYESLTAKERAELEGLIAASFDATIARTHGLPRLNK